MSKLKLPTVTLIAVDGVRQSETIASMYKSMALVDFAECVFITNIDMEVEGISCVNVGGLKSIEAYSEFIIVDLCNHFFTSHCLIVQSDSHVLDANAWSETFLYYDYIGSTWLYKDGRNMGNGGFSLRSKKLQMAIANNVGIDIFHPEDEVISRLYRKLLEKEHLILFAPDDVANKFSFELNPSTQSTFGFHSYFHKPFKEHVIIRRINGATGDVCMAEPLVDYYCKKGFQVVLDVPHGDMRLFASYPYYIKHISEMDSRINPIKDINLTMAYEIKPLQLVLKSYYQIAGIKDGEIRNSRLYVEQQEHQKLFKKYIVIHNDETSMPYRNTNGVNWKLIVANYERLGYTVLQLGNNPKEQVATHFNCPTKDMLLYICCGASLVIGIDSGICQISVALGVPCVILTGSVNLKLRYSNFEKIEVVQGECPRKELKNCYHNSLGCVGTKCVIDEYLPPCSIHSEFEIIKSANKLLKI